MATLSSGAAGVPASRKYPSVYTQVRFGANPNSAGGAVRSLLVIGNKTAAGTIVVDTEIAGPLTPDSAVTKGGTGSELALGVASAALAEPGATIYAAAPTVSAGVAATATLTVVGTATADGNLEVRIHGYKVNVSIQAGQVIATQATNIANAINGKGAYLNVTASPAAGVVTLTARHAGTRSNSITLFVTPDSSITGSTYTLSGAVMGSVTAGTLVDDITTVMTTISARKFDLIALAQIDTTNLQVFQTKVLANAGPLVRKRSQGICCVTTSQGTATTQATTLNEPLLQIIWNKAGDNLSIQVAGAFGARRSVKESDNPDVNLSLFNPDVVDLYTAGIVAPYSEANYMLESEANSALDSGLTPLVVRQSDKHMLIALSITSHSQDSSGAPDTRTLTTNYVTVPFKWADEIEAFVPTAFAGMVLRDEPVDGDEPLPPLTTTPNTIKGFLIDLYKRKYDITGFIKNFDVDTARWQYNLDASNVNRVDSTMQVTPAPWFTQFSVRIDQLNA